MRGQSLNQRTLRGQKKGRADTSKGLITDEEHMLWGQENLGQIV